ncbi:hypothetical protein DPMN_056018 [Dreissena polymorpha]|uniref:Uncharacterized protein n=1 Tax=Dreissena polymorpha TaxID=45954 RepID=A0A9D4CTP9_DREPO|nr:hypothetical protein DPMN_056018 [Dreissena polymorpha]
MPGRVRSVRRWVVQAVAKQTERGRGMRAAVDSAPAKEQRSRWRRRNAAETAPVPEPASAPVPGPQPEAAPAVAPPAKRKRTDDNAANGEVVDFCDIFRTADGLPRGHNVGKHEAQACNANEIVFMSTNSSLSKMDNIQRIYILHRQTNDDVSIYVSASLTQRHVFVVANMLILHYCLKPPEFHISHNNSVISTDQN